MSRLLMETKVSMSLAEAISKINDNPEFPDRRREGRRLIPWLGRRRRRRVNGSRQHADPRKGV